MALPVVIVASGGLAMNRLSVHGGLPVTLAAQGLAVTEGLPGLGLPMTFVTEGGSIVLPGPPPFSPTDLGTSLKSWYAFEALAGADGAPISTLTDLSGNGNNLTQTGTLRATKAQAHQNGKNTLKFAAASKQRYALPNIYSGASSGSGYIVARMLNDPPLGGAEVGLWNFGTDAAADAWPYMNGIIYTSWGSTVRKTCGDPAVSMATTYRIYSVYSALNDWALFIDGGAGGSAGGTTAFFSTVTNTVGFDSTPWIGINDDLTGAFDGWIAEVVLTTAKQSTTDRQKMEGYLAHKWGIAANLAAAHPYKSAPP